MSRSVLGMLLVILAVLTAGTWDRDEVDSATPDVPSYTDGPSYGIERPYASQDFVQPIPVVLTVVHEHVSRGQSRLCTDVHPFATRRISPTHIPGESPDHESACLDCDGRHRHQWIRTYRC